MKVSVSFAVVMIAFFSSTLTMERPSLIPSHEYKSSNPRSDIVKAISEAVYGPSRARELTLADLPSGAEDASPNSLYAMCRSKLQEWWLEDIKKHGISLQDLEKQFPAVDNFLQERIKKRTLSSVPAGSPLKRIMTSVSNAMNLPDMEIRVHDKNTIAACVGGFFIVCNPAELSDEAPTPRKVRHVLGHERRHAVNEDTKLRLAYKYALRSAGKNPDHYKKTMQIGQRIGEVFSDLETAALGQDWANAYAEISARSEQRKGDYKPTSHPTRASRRTLGERNKHFYHIWMQEQKKLQNEPVPTETACEIVQPRTVARKLFEEQ